jgi:hypothetical protein
MIIDCNYKDENKGFSNLEKQTLHELFDELNNIQNPISKFEIFQIEYKVTEFIKNYWIFAIRIFSRISI